MREETSTEIHKAIVRAEEEECFLDISLGDETVIIPLSKDQPNEVKQAFNRLIIKLKAGLFRIELEETGEDLYSQVAKEYLAQLNGELEEVFGEMVSMGLSGHTQEQSL